MASYTGKSVKKHTRSKSGYRQAISLSTAPAYAPAESQLKEEGQNSRNIVRHKSLPDPFWNPNTPSYNYTPTTPRPNYQEGLSLQSDYNCHSSRTPTATSKLTSQPDSSPYSSLAPQPPQDLFTLGTPFVILEPLFEDKPLPPVQIKLEHTYSTKLLTSFPTLPNFGQIRYALQTPTAITRRVSFAETIKQESNDHLPQHISNTLPFKSRQKRPPVSNRSQPAVTPVKQPTKRRRQPIIKKSSSPPPSKPRRKSVRKQSSSPPPSLVNFRLRPTSRRVAKLLKHQDNLCRVECEQKRLNVKLLIHPSLLRNLKIDGYIFPSNYNPVPKLFKTQYPLPNRFYSRGKKKGRDKSNSSIATRPFSILSSLNSGIPGNVYQDPFLSHPQTYTASDLIDTIYPGYFEEKMAPGVSRCQTAIETIAECSTVSNPEQAAE
jgi:hypothetical protein